METRVNIIRSRNKIPPARYTIDHEHVPHHRTEFASLNRTEDLKSHKEITADLETDQLSTNFNPQKP
jgi:hypothetical protein